MTLLKRKRLRKLRFWLLGNPALVVPAPVVGPSERKLAMARDLPSEVPDHHFLWGPGLPPQTNQWTLRLPSDPLVANSMVARPSRAGERATPVTYDPHASRDRLLAMLRTPTGKEYDTPADSGPPIRAQKGTNVTNRP